MTGGSGGWMAKRSRSWMVVLQQGSAVRPEQIERGLILVLAVLAGTVVAATVHETGVIQGRYDVGARTWVEGSFGWLYLIVMAAASLLALGAAVLVGRAVPKVSLLPVKQAGVIRRGLRDLVVVVVAAMWIGYGAGWASSWLAGPTVERSGTVRFTFVAPASATVDLAATCISVVGDGDVLAEVDTVVPGGPVVWIRHRIYRNADPTLIAQPEDVTLLVPSSPPAYLDGYLWVTRSFVEDTDEGRMRLTGHRGYGAGPSEVDLEITWSCQGRHATP